MKIRCAKDALFAGIQTVQRAVSGRSTLPILNNILMEADGERLCLVAYDLEFGIECALGVTIDTPGGTTVPARILAEVVGNLPQAEVCLEVDERQMVSIKCGSAQYSIHGLPAEEFPRLPLLQEGTTVKVSRLELRQLIRETAFASSVDETRPILTGVLTTVDSDALAMVATDGHRLAWAEGPLLEPGREPASAIIAGRVYGELLRLLGVVEGDECELQITENQVQFSVGDVALQSRLIDGEFPNWRKVIPKEQGTSVTAERDGVRDAIRRAAIVAREDANKVIIAATEDGLIITADSQEVGTAREMVPAQLEGQSLTVGFNARYLLDVLNVVETEEIMLGLSGPAEKGLITPLGREDYKYVIMPMQLS